MFDSIAFRDGLFHLVIGPSILAKRIWRCGMEVRDLVEVGDGRDGGEVSEEINSLQFSL